MDMEDPEYCIALSLHEELKQVGDTREITRMRIDKFLTGLPTSDHHAIMQHVDFIINLSEKLSRIYWGL